ncbi:MAG TPA: hypothetical protein VGD43_22390, partial [Micromonospora sp.]
MHGWTDPLDPDDNHRHRVTPMDDRPPYPPFAGPGDPPTERYPVNLDPVPPGRPAGADRQPVDIDWWTAPQSPLSGVGDPFHRSTGPDHQPDGHPTGRSAATHGHPTAGEHDADTPPTWSADPYGYPAGPERGASTQPAHLSADPYGYPADGHSAGEWAGSEPAGTDPRSGGRRRHRRHHRFSRPVAVVGAVT